MATTSQRNAARAAGFYVRQVTTHGSAGRLGRWYLGHINDNAFTASGLGYETPRDAWAAAVREMQLTRDAEATGRASIL